jgi:hypothetical protein
MFYILFDLPEPAFWGGKYGKMKKKLYKFLCRKFKIVLLVDYRDTGPAGTLVRARLFDLVSTPSVVALSGLFGLSANRWNSF